MCPNFWLVLYIKVVYIYTYAIFAYSVASVKDSNAATWRNIFMGFFPFLELQSAGGDDRTQERSVWQQVCDVS